MYKFQIVAHTKMGESIGIVGSVPELGLWDINKCIKLKTSNNAYPLWWTEKEFFFGQYAGQKIEYKYLKLFDNDEIKWEALGENRWIPIDPDEQKNTIIVYDGNFGEIQPWPLGYFQDYRGDSGLIRKPEGLKILLLGSSVSAGADAWLLRGWSWHLSKELNKKYGHELINLSEFGANVNTTINRFPQVFAPLKPDIVIISLSFGNEGLANCKPYERKAVQRRFESGLLHLIKMIKESGAIPVLGGLYPNNNFNADHCHLLMETHNKMLGWSVPVLDWLDKLNNGKGQWKKGLFFDAGHPNTIGHSIMYDAIDLNIFNIRKDDIAIIKNIPEQKQKTAIYSDDMGLHVFFCADEHSLRIVNATDYKYNINKGWQDFQNAIKNKTTLLPGIYIEKNSSHSAFAHFFVSEERIIETSSEIPPSSDIDFIPFFNLFSPEKSDILFYDGKIGVLKKDKENLYIINETNHEYNIQPMWREVRLALKNMPNGVYEDIINKDIPFRTIIIGDNGLESRVKAPPKSVIIFKYTSKLSDFKRIGIIPLGHRCAARMLLYKMGFDGPCFPFCLSRTMNLSDVADIIENNFHDMWNPSMLHYNSYDRRIYHSKWTGLSFGHEVEDFDDPIRNIFPVFERMKKRYSARAERFWHSIKNADEILFIRTGIARRESVDDIEKKLKAKCNGKTFRFLLISPQNSDEFNGIPNVIHYNIDFDPDRMYRDMDYWLSCAEIMKNILLSMGVNSKNLYWCPNRIPKDDTQNEKQDALDSLSEFACGDICAHIIRSCSKAGFSRC